MKNNKIEKFLKNKVFVKTLFIILILFIFIVFVIINLKNNGVFSKKEKVTKTVVASESTSCEEGNEENIFLNYQISTSEDGNAIIVNDCLSGVTFSQTLEKEIPTPITLNGVLYSVSIDGNEITITEN